MLSVPHIFLHFLDTERLKSGNQKTLRDIRKHIDMQDFKTFINGQNSLGFLGSLHFLVC
jgi:hypothetical protein